MAAGFSRSIGGSPLALSRLPCILVVTRPSVIYVRDRQPPHPHPPYARINFLLAGIPLGMGIVPNLQSCSQKARARIRQEKKSENMVALALRHSLLRASSTGVENLWSVAAIALIYWFRWQSRACRRPQFGVF